MNKYNLFIVIFFILIVLFDILDWTKQVIHYSLVKYHSITQENYVNLAFSKMKIPENSYLRFQDNNETVLQGAFFDKEDRRIKISIFKNIDALKKNSFYLEKESCINLDEEITVMSETTFYDKNNSSKLEFPSNVLFCKNSFVSDKSYVAYYNQALMTLIIISPYQYEYKKEYVNLIENFEFNTNKKDLPKWIFKK